MHTLNLEMPTRVRRTEYSAQRSRELIKGLKEHYDAVCGNVHGAVNITGIYITLVSGLLKMFGWDNFLWPKGTIFPPIRRLRMPYSTMRCMSNCLVDSPKNSSNCPNEAVSAQ